MFEEPNCVGCRFYKRERDIARAALARSTTGEEHATIQKLRKEIRQMQKAAERRNQELDAMHWVWCDGGCETGVHRFDGKGPEAITEEIVAQAERNTARLKRWLAIRNYPQERANER